MMEKLGFIGKFLRFIYTQVFLRFSKQIRDPYLIRVDNIYTDTVTNELKISFHIANKRVNQKMTVARFVKTDMIYLIDPLVVFEVGNQFGIHSEKLLIAKKTDTSLKKKCIAGLKRVFVDE